jgi:ribosomal protein L22
VTPEQAQNQSYSNNFTTGDYMQIAAALSRAGNFQRPEVETPNLDLTNITRNAYDVNPVLGQNNRNYQNALNNTTTSSPNLRRAIANQLYGQKLNQDSNSLEQYQQMNNQATTQYEDRLSNQRRFNAQQTGYTQDINARNRGAGMNARQAAFDQLGTVGVMLNKRKENQTYINALKVRYPDISDSVLKDILG